MSSTKTKLLDSAQKNLLKGQYSRAVADYRQIIQLEPSDMRHRQKLAEILTKANLKDEAVTEYTSLAKHYIESVHYLKAIAVYKQIQKLDPTNPEISLTLASLNEKQGLIGNATAEYASALQIYESNEENLKALKVLESMLALDPGNSAVRLRIAEKYFAVGKENNSFDEFLALATDLKSRDDENGYMHVSDKIRQLFKDRSQELFRKIEGEQQDEVPAPVTPIPDEAPKQPAPIKAELPQVLPTEKKQTDVVVEVLPVPLPSATSIVAETIVEDIPLIEELEELDELEELASSADEPEWEEDIELDLDVTHAEPSTDDELIQDIEEYEESGPAIELDELELEDIELELDDEQLEEADYTFETEEISQPGSEAVDTFDLAVELSMFADEIDFDLIRTSSDSLFTLDTASGFKRNELDNEDAESHYSLGLAYKEMGLFDEAISEFIVASKSQERKIDSLILKAVCFREQGETEKAV